jgi:LysR family cyn operon transcriptional activator
MEIRQLKYFQKLAETLNFSEASRELFITQSTLSQQILNLERELDQQLFLRNSHEVVLTEAGQMLVPMARESLHTVDNCLQQMQDLKHLLTGQLNIGVTYSFSSIMAETMIDFLKRYPKVRLNVCYSSMTELIDKLMRHELDFVLAFKPTEHNDRIESRVLFNNRLAAIVNEHHVLAQQTHITLDQLERYCLAMPAKGLQARNAFDKVISHTDHHYKIKVEINTVGLLFKLVSQTKYVTVLSESTVIDEPGLKAIPIDVPAGNMEGCIHTLKNGYLKASAKEFIHLLGQSTAILKNSTLKGM